MGAMVLHRMLSFCPSLQRVFEKPHRASLAILFVVQSLTFDSHPTRLDGNSSSEPTCTVVSLTKVSVNARSGSSVDDSIVVEARLFKLTI